MQDPVEAVIHHVVTLAATQGGEGPLCVVLGRCDGKGRGGFRSLRVSVLTTKE